MNILEFLKGKKIQIKTDVGVTVELEIKEVKRNHHREDLGPATPQNDWWPESREWNTYTIYFVNGHSKTFASLDDIQVL